MTVYVAGFLLDDDHRVALVRKKRPEWQAGKLNAVGGKVEPYETPQEAMRREFWEEAGLDFHDEWEHLCLLSFEGGVVWFYRLFVSAEELNAVKTRTDERIEIHSVPDILDQFAYDHEYDPNWHEHRALPNLSWLLPLAVYRHDRYVPFEVREAR